MEAVAIPCNENANEKNHGLSGVSATLSISLTDLTRLEEPAFAETSAMELPGSAATGSSSPTHSITTHLAGEEEEQITPEDAPSSLTPWEHPDATDTDVKDEAFEDPSAEGAKKGVHKQAWTSEEDTKLVELVHLHGASNWSRIAEGLPSRSARPCAPLDPRDAPTPQHTTRTCTSSPAHRMCALPVRAVGKQCRERWHNHLSPAVKKEVRTPSTTRTTTPRAPPRYDVPLTAAFFHARRSHFPPKRIRRSWRRSPSTARSGRTL